MRRVVIVLCDENTIWQRLSKINASQIDSIGMTGTVNLLCLSRLISLDNREIGNVLVADTVNYRVFIIPLRRNNEVSIGIVCCKQCNTFDIRC